MKKRSLLFLFFLVGLMCLSGCSLIYWGTYGVKPQRKLVEKNILYWGEKYDIPPSDIYELDSSYYSFLRSRQTEKNRLTIKNHYQPLQALYFDRTGYVQSYHVNCWAGGFPNLAWDRDSILTTFPPKMQAPLDSLLTLDDQLSFLRPLSQTAAFNKDDFDYVVVVYWNRYMGRQSKRFVRFIQENNSLAGDRKLKIIYANNDNL